MAFPSSPTNGQQTTQNGVVYTYDSTLTAWIISSSTTGTISASEITSSGNITGANFITAGLITAIGNVTGNYFLGNGSQLTGLPVSYSNAEVASYLASGTNTSNIITTGNVTGGNLNVVGLISANVISGNTLSATGNITGGNITGANVISSTTLSATANVIGGNISTAGLITATGNVTGGNLNGAGLSLSSNVVSALNVTGNIAGGNITTPGLISVTGTIFADQITTVSVPLVLNDISTQCDGAQMVFPLKIDQSNITSANITQSKNLQVAVNGLILSPWINVQTWPWFQLFAGFPGLSPGYQVISTATSANITFYTSPAKGSQVVLTIINSSSTAQLRKYPYSATTIVLGD